MARPFGSKNKRTVEREKSAAEDIAKRRAALEAAGIPVAKSDDPLVYLTELMIDESQPRDVRMKAATELAPYRHARKTENVNINNVRYVCALPDGELSLTEWQARVKPTAEEQISIKETETKH